MVRQVALRRCGAGFTYFGVLLLVAMLGAGLSLAGEVWQTAALREREAELLHVGSEYRAAIARYYLTVQRQYPRALADLIRDPRQPGVVRHLRRLYPDPITGRDEWGLVRAPDGGIAGVYSLSEEKPIKIAGFSVPDREFEGKEKYADWKFMFALSPATRSPP